MKRTYLDACVLITAFKGEEEEETQQQQEQQLAANMLNDPDRELVVSDYLRLEVLPSPTFQGKLEEVNFLNNIFDHAKEDLPTSPELTKCALDIAKKCNLKAMDALHVGAAIIAKVDELVTMEGEKSEMHRAKEYGVKVLTLKG